MKKTALPLAAALLAQAPALPAQTPQEQLDSRLRAVAQMLDAKLEKEAVPGAALGVIHDQQLVWSYRHGVESLDTARPVTDDTVFSICSVSKLFNGIAAMNLVEAGKLSLDAPLADYLDGVAPVDSTGAEEPATLRGVLSHVSGLPREGVEDYWADNAFPDTQALLASTGRHEQLYTPYDHWQYSNLGMALVGEAIARAAGVSWGEYVQDTVLAPLDMMHTTTDMPFDRVGEGFARGYYVRNGHGERKPVQEHSFDAYAPAAGIASSVNDMARFASWNFRLRKSGGEEILRATTLRQMQRLHWMGAEFDEPAWGLAFAARRYGDETLWGHGGYCPGARTEFVMRLPDETAYVMMLTANDVSPGSIVKTVYSIVNSQVSSVYAADSKSDSAADPAVVEQDGPPALTDYEGYYAVENYDWDVYIGLDEGGLFSLPIYASDPVDGMEHFVREDGDRFRRKRDDGSLAEPVTFERDADGRVVALVQHSYRSLRRGK